MVWRHEARVTGLVPGVSARYVVVDRTMAGDVRLSPIHRLQPLPPAGAPLRIFLTSDHQAFPMAAANIRKLADIAPKIDAVFFAGDRIPAPARDRLYRSMRQPL